MLVVVGAADAVQLLVPPSLTWNVLSLLLTGVARGLGAGTFSAGVGASIAPCIASVATCCCSCCCWCVHPESICSSCSSRPVGA